MQSQTSAYLCAAAAILAWSTVASAFKISLRYFEPLQLVALASLFSTTALFLILVVQRKINVLRQFSKTQLRWCLLLALLNPCLYYVVLLEAYDRLLAQEALVLNYSWPVMLSILSVLILKQKLRSLEIVAIAIAYLGVVVIATQGNVLNLNFNDSLGVGLALVSTVIWALYWIFNVKHKQDAVVVLFLSFLLSMPFLGVATYFVAPLQRLSFVAVASAAYVGLFEMGFAFVLWLTALQLSSSAAKISTLAFVSPFLSLLLINWVIGEKIQPATWAGLLFVAGGIMVQTLVKQRVATSKSSL